MCHVVPGVLAQGLGERLPEFADIAESGKEGRLGLAVGMGVAKQIIGDLFSRNDRLFEVRQLHFAVASCTLRIHSWVKPDGSHPKRSIRWAESGVSRRTRIGTVYGGLNLSAIGAKLWAPPATASPRH